MGRKIGDRWLLDASPTALVIVMDPENHFETQYKRDKGRRNLQHAIREELRYQDADISQSELDFLVHVRVWGDNKYELANFSDDELAPAITQLATTQQRPRVTSPAWDHDLRRELDVARASHQDIKVPLGHMGVRDNKVQLARLLWPVLQSKAEAESVAGSIQTPGAETCRRIRQLVGRQWYLRTQGALRSLGRHALRARIQCEKSAVRLGDELIEAYGCHPSSMPSATPKQNHRAKQGR